MKVCYADNSSPSTHDLDAIFLAGPTPRSREVMSWRPAALSHLIDMGYDGTIFVPERADWTAHFEYDHQTEWEYANLLHSRVIVFWVAREMKEMPALTTNVEFGYWLARRPGQVIYGRPDWAVKTKYLDWLYQKHVHMATGYTPPISDTLSETLRRAVEMTQIL